jgi:murein DD-endopeptidase MepM/ murein hydrolase activator NlpD
MAGYVAGVSYSGYGYGNTVLVDHGDNITSLYAHLSKILVFSGQEVGLDTIIGQIGASGRAYGDHLHLEIRDNGYPVNPHILLPR